MKKYITTAALFAAGTALADAAATLSSVWTDFGTTSDVGTISGGTTNTNGTVSTTSSSYATITLSTALAADSSAASWSVIMSFDASSLSTETASTLFAMDVVTTGDSPRTYGALAGAYYTPTAQTVTASCFTNSGTLSATLPSSGTLTFVYSRSGTSSPTLSVYSGTTSLGTATFASGSLQFSGTISTIRVGGHGDVVSTGWGTGTMSAAPSNSEVTLTSFAVCTGGVADATVMSSYFAAANIPEPSAFGLLAGAGALALVASRRRRRAK